MNRIMGVSRDTSRGRDRTAALTDVVVELPDFGGYLMPLDLHEPLEGASTERLSEGAH